MWPFLLDYSRDECKRTLRRLELEAYSSVVSCFRAQGNLSQEKKKILKELQHMLSISEERHRAEVRRAVNDEKLSTVADSNGSSPVTSEWLIEGRRLVPILPRLVPQTTFTQTATQAAKEAADKNATLINPALTGNKELASQSTIPAAPAAKPSRPSSPTSNVVVLPSGTSIHIKGMLTPEEEDEPLGRRQRRSLSIDGLGAATASTQTQTARVIYTTAPATPGSTSPVKITISKSPQGRTIVSQPGGQPPKVILVTSQSNQQSVASAMFQRSMSVPVIRASTSSSTSHGGATRTSIIIPGSPGLAHAASMPGVVTVTTTSITTSTTSNTVTMPTSVVSATPVFTPSINIGKPRPKMVPRQRFPPSYLLQPQNKPGLVMGPGMQPVAPTPHNLHNIQLKTVPKAPPIHIKQEGGMKIITQSVAGASKILPKPVQMSGSPGTPVVVVNAGPSSGNTTVTMVPKTVSGYASAGGNKVLNITTPGGRVITTTSKASNVVTVNPKTLQLTAVKSNSGGTTVSKPNVIVVQKTQARRPQLPTHITKGGTTVITSPAAFEKELANFIQKESGRQVSVSISPSGTVTSATAVGGRAPEHRVIITTTSSTDPSRQGTVQKLVSADPDNRTSLLAELIQAAGINTEGDTSGGNEWFEYDVEDSGQSVADPSIQTIMGLPNTKIVQRSVSMDDQSGIPQEQYYSLEQAVSLLNCEGVDGGSVVVSQPNQCLLTTASEGLKTTVELPRRLPANLLSQQTVMRSEMEVSPRSGEITLQQPGSSGGELDPQTGLFYSTGSMTGHQQIMVNTRDGSILTSQGPVTLARQMQHVASEVGRRASPIVPFPVVVSQGRTAVMSHAVVSGPVNAPQVSASPQLSAAQLQPHVDLVRSSLAQAQINLESFDFEDDEDDGMGPYGPLDGDEDGGVAGEGFVDDQPSLSGCGDEEGVMRINFDAHTALLEESEAGVADLVATGTPDLSDLPAMSISVSVPPLPPSPPLLDPPPLKQPTPAPTVPPPPAPTLNPGRSAAFVTLPDVKEIRSSTFSLAAPAQNPKDSTAISSSSSGTTSTPNNLCPRVLHPSSSSASRSIVLPTKSLAVSSTAVSSPAVSSLTAVPTSHSLTQCSASNSTVQKVVVTVSVSNSSVNSVSVGGGKPINSAASSVSGNTGPSSVNTNSVTCSGAANGSLATNSSAMPVNNFIVANSNSVSSNGISAVNNNNDGCLTEKSCDAASSVSYAISTVTSSSSVVTAADVLRPALSAPSAAVVVELPAGLGSGSGGRPLAGSDFNSKFAHSASASPPALVVRGSNPVSMPSDCGQGQHEAGRLQADKVRAVALDRAESAGVLTVHKLESSAVFATHKTDVLGKLDNLPLHRIDSGTALSVRKSDSVTVLPVHKSDSLTLLPVHNTDSLTVLTESDVVSSAASLLTSVSHVMDFANLTGDQDASIILADTGPSGTDGLGLLDSNSVRQSKRKRRPPSALEEAAGSSAGGSWVKTAQSILAKVSRYRGTNREKGELNASAWFTQPVDPVDAPDYYSIIKSPMDFGTIRRKLEAGQYTQFDDFHSDMLLVRSNCLTYNPSHTRVYRDCNQVFNYYNQEIDKMLEKSVSRTHPGSPARKQLRTEKSPVKT